MKTYNTRYLAKTDDGLVWIDVALDFSVFLEDCGSEYAAIEQACEVFERNCSNFVEW
jgi:hypothetical protein